MGECGKCLWHVHPGIWCFNCMEGETERFKVTLGSVSDCSIHWSMPCVVTLAADKGNSLHLPLWIPLKSHTVPVLFRQKPESL